MSSLPRTSSSASAASASAAPTAAELAQKKARLEELKRKAPASLNSDSDSDDNSSSSSDDDDNKKHSAPDAARIPMQKRARVDAPAAAAAAASSRMEEEEEEESSDEDDEEEEDKKKKKQKQKQKPQQKKKKPEPKKRSSKAAEEDDDDDDDDEKLKEPKELKAAEIKVGFRLRHSFETSPFVQIGEIIDVPEEKDDKGVRPATRHKVVSLGYNFQEADPKYYPLKEKGSLPDFLNPCVTFKDYNFATVRLGPNNEEFTVFDSWLQTSPTRVFHLNYGTESQQGHCRSVIFRDFMGPDATPPSAAISKEDPVLNKTLLDKLKKESAVRYKNALEVQNKGGDEAASRQPIVPWGLYYDLVQKNKNPASAASKRAKKEKETPPPAAAASSASSAAAAAPSQASPSSSSNIELTAGMQEMMRECLEDEVRAVYASSKKQTISVPKTMHIRTQPAFLVNRYATEPHASNLTPEVRRAVGRIMLAMHPEGHKLVADAMARETKKEEEEAVRAAETMEMDG